MTDIERPAVSRAAMGSGVLLTLIGALIAAGAAAGLLATAAPRQRIEWVAIAAIGLAAIGIGLYQLLLTLEWTSEHLALNLGPWRRSVSLSTLTEVGYRRSGRTAFLLLRDRQGRRLSVAVSGFPRDDEWKAAILNGVRVAGGHLDARAAKTLAHANGSGRGYLA